MKALVSVLAFSLLLNVSFLFIPPFEQPHDRWSSAARLNSLRVRNLDTGRNYSMIQEAINAPETVDGHEILVGSGKYCGARENNVILAMVFGVVSVLVFVVIKKKHWVGSRLFQKKGEAYG